MSTLLIAIASFFGFIIAYHTYGRWIARRVFGLDPKANVPSHELRDDVDFVPTKKSVIFGHHFTSIAGTGPIVGPAIAVFWGWLPALLWVIFGSIFIGAVHDFGALVVSLRNRGQTVGDVAGRLIAPRAKILFLAILFMALTVVLAIFGLVIAIIFANYPETVLPVWISMPIAIGIGFWVYKRGGGLLIPSILALATIYLSIYIGTYYLPIDIGRMLGIPLMGPGLNVVILWTGVLLVYCFVAAVIPVWVLLQPRDYVNSHQLVVALVLLGAGLLFASIQGQAEMTDIPAVAKAADIPTDAPPIWPFLFITIACGACSGFHCLVSSGTSSKQVASEIDAQYVGYGAMLLEGGLAVVVILACCAGVAMGQLERDPATGDYGYVAATITPSDDTNASTESTAPTHIAGVAAWRAYYPKSRMKPQADGSMKEVGGWESHSLGNKVGAFIDGGANFLSTIGIPLKLGVCIVAVLVACFAATTLDTATRLQRYVIQELAASVRLTPLTNKYAATGLAAGLGCLVALIPASPAQGPGSGGLILWPLFGAVNQLLAGLALMVTVFYLWRRKKPVLFALIPMLIMLLMPAWAMLWQMFNAEGGWLWNGKYLLFSFGVAVMGLQIWMVVEGLLMFPRADGILEEALPPLVKKSDAHPELVASGGRSC